MSIRNPKMYQNRYTGNYEETQCDKILKIRKMSKVPQLEHNIYNFDNELVERSIVQEASIREILVSEGKNLNDYLGTMRDYQTVGTAFLYNSPKSILADGVGLGKTVELSALLNILFARNESKRVLIAVESSALEQTKREIIRFTGLRTIDMLTNIDTMPQQFEYIENNLEDIKVIVVKHSMLSNDTFQNWLTQHTTLDNKCDIFDTFILDESSIVKNNKTKTYTYIENICSLANRIHFLNATAFETNLMDVFFQLDMLNKELLPAKTNIQKQFCVITMKPIWRKNPYGGKAMRINTFEITGYKNQHIFKEALELVYFGRSKSDVGLAKQEHIYKVVECTPTWKQQDAINKKYTWNEVLNSPTTYPELNIPLTPDEVPKLAKLINIVKEYPSDKIMIYCFNIEAQKAIKEEMEKLGRKPIILNGNITDKKRNETIKEFNYGDSDIIITNVKKSLNLNKGNICIFYTFETNPAKMEQIRGRIDRNVDDNIKTFILLVYVATPEYMFFKEITRQRNKDSQDLIQDTKSAIDYFINSD